MNLCKHPAVHRRILALGSNLPGPWGPPAAALARALDELEHAGVHILRRSRCYSTRPVGPGRQARYLNMVVLVETSLPPAALVRALKRLERRAGRRLGRVWGPRPLDIDLIDYQGRRIGWPPGRRRAHLVLPHPELHRRAFVLVPLREACPAWRHPVFGATLPALLSRLPRRRGDIVPERLDFAGPACEKTRV